MQKYFFVLDKVFIASSAEEGNYFTLSVHKVSRVTAVPNAAPCLLQLVKVKLQGLKYGRRNIQEMYSTLCPPIFPPITSLSKIIEEENYDRSLEQIVFFLVFSQGSNDF